MGSFLNRVAFLLRSTNQHGVHSPFVYRYVTECLYAKPKMRSPKSEGVFERTQMYFGYQASIRSLKDFQNENGFDLPDHQKILELAFLEWKDWKDHVPIIPEIPITEDGCIILTDIYRDKSSKSQWDSLCSSPNFQVSIDLYYCGLLFKRQSQEKEHFMIRI